MQSGSNWRRVRDAAHHACESQSGIRMLILLIVGIGRDGGDQDWETTSLNRCARFGSPNSLGCTTSRTATIAVRVCWRDAVASGMPGGQAPAGRCKFPILDDHQRRTRAPLHDDRPRSVAGSRGRQRLPALAAIRASRREHISRQSWHVLVVASNETKPKT